MRDQPGDLIIERLGVPGGVTGPRHRGNRHPVGRTAHPRRLSLDEHLHRAGIQRPPPAPSLTLVVTTATPTTTPTPTTGTSSQPTRHDDHLEVFVELDALYHHLMVNADHPAPYPLRLHPVAPRSTPSRRQPESQAGQRGAPADGQLPTHGTGRRARKVRRCPNSRHCSEASRSWRRSSSAITASRTP